jgi:hypothetical protein
MAEADHAGFLGGLFDCAEDGAGAGSIAVPAGVSSTRRLLRLNSAVPSSSSNGGSAVAAGA